MELENLNDSEKKVLYIFYNLMEQVGNNMNNYYRDNNYVIYKDESGWVLLQKEKKNGFNYQLFSQLHSLCLYFFTTLDQANYEYCITNFLKMLKEEIGIEEINKYFNIYTKRK